MHDELDVDQKLDMIEGAARHVLDRVASIRADLQAARDLEREQAARRRRLSGLRLVGSWIPIGALAGLAAKLYHAQPAVAATLAGGTAVTATAAGITAGVVLYHPAPHRRPVAKPPATSQIWSPPPGQTPPVSETRPAKPKKSTPSPSPTATPVLTPSPTPSGTATTPVVPPEPSPSPVVAAPAPSPEPTPPAAVDTPEPERFPDPTPTPTEPAPAPGPVASPADPAPEPPTVKASCVGVDLKLVRVRLLCPPE
jgi:hypothetical protein